MVHSVLRRLTAPPAGNGVDVVDLAHEIPLGDVRAGAALLERAAPYLAPGVVVGVVDPGVGSDRRRVALECPGLVLVGPDNGLLTGAADLLGITGAVELAEPRFWLTADTSTFDGRDVFAPVAALLCNGVPLDALGPPVRARSLVRLTRPRAALVAGDLVAEVVWVDGFGNVALPAGPAELEALGPGPYVVEAGSTRQAARRVRSFAELAEGEIGLMIDSSGQVALVADRRRAADCLAVSTGSQIRVTRA